MTKHKKPKKRKHAGYTPPPADPVAILQTLKELLEQLSSADASQAGPLWGQTHQTLLKTDVDKQAIIQIIASRDMGALIVLIGAIEHGEDLSNKTPPPSDEPTREFDPDQLKQAMRAYRKRLKLTRLDDESRLSVSPMTGGKTSQIRAILPPHEYERDVWDELVRQGKLLNAKGGFYELADEKPNA